MPVAGADPNPRGNVPSNPPPNKRRRDLGAPSIRKYLAGDTAYQDQMSQLQLGLDQFLAQNRRSRKQTRADFQNTQGDMLYQKQQDLRDMAGDFASRGLMNSGLYVQDRGNYANEFQRSLRDLILDKSRNLKDLLLSRNQYKSNVDLEGANARREAIRRRAIRYGITPR